MEKFNENLEQLIKNLSKINGDINYSKYYDFTDPGDKYVNMFYKNCSKFSNDIANKDEIIFSEENTILDNINFNQIWNSDLSDENRSVIWNYLHTLFIFAYEHIKNVDIKNILKTLKGVSSDDDDLDNDTKTLINIINSLTNKFNYDNIEEVNENDENENMSYELPQIFNGTIGNLAKEIAQEIDTNAINLDDPASLLKDLMSGNFDENNDQTGIVNLVKNITSKIQNKLSDGDIQESDLVSDAESLMKNFSNPNSSMGGLEGMGDLGNMFSSLMSNMGNMTGMQKGAMKTNMERTMSSNETKKRLKQKLEEKKKLLLQQEKILEDELNNLNTADVRDIDDLVNEIEGFNIPNKKKKKKNKSLNLK